MLLTRKLVLMMTPAQRLTRSGFSQMTLAKSVFSDGISHSNSTYMRKMIDVRSITCMHTFTTLLTFEASFLPISQRTANNNSVNKAGIANTSYQAR